MRNRYNLFRVIVTHQDSLKLTIPLKFFSLYFYGSNKTETMTEQQVLDAFS